MVESPRVGRGIPYSGMRGMIFLSGSCSAVDFEFALDFVRSGGVLGVLEKQSMAKEIGGFHGDTHLLQAGLFHGKSQSKIDDLEVPP